MSRSMSITATPTSSSIMTALPIAITMITSAAKHPHPLHEQPSNIAILPLVHRAQYPTRVQLAQSQSPGNHERSPSFSVRYKQDKAKVVKEGPSRPKDSGSAAGFSSLAAG